MKTFISTTTTIGQVTPYLVWDNGGFATVPPEGGKVMIKFYNKKGDIIGYVSVTTDTLSMADENGVCLMSRGE